MEDEETKIYSQNGTPLGTIATFWAHTHLEPVTNRAVTVSSKIFSRDWAAFFCRRRGREQTNSSVINSSRARALHQTAKTRTSAHAPRIFPQRTRVCQPTRTYIIYAETTERDKNDTTTSRSYIFDQEEKGCGRLPDAFFPGRALRCASQEAAHGERTLRC